MKRRNIYEDIARLKPNSKFRQHLISLLPSCDGMLSITNITYRMGMLSLEEQKENER